MTTQSPAIVLESVERKVLYQIQLVKLAPILSQEEFAAFVGTTKCTVKGWINNKTIPSVKMGKQRFVDIVNLTGALQMGKEYFKPGDYAG